MASLRGARLVCISPRGLGRRLGESTRKAAFVGAAALVIAVSATSGAQAQNCGPSVIIPFFGPLNITPLYTAGVSASVAVSASVSSADTAFLTQSTAFVSAPPNPKPNSEGSGLWIRGVGGELNIKGTSTVIPAFTGLAGLPTVTCTSKFRQDFSGFQLGQDVATLNYMGWNLHLGTTAGYLETNGHIVGGNPIGGSFSSTTQVPFVGTYVVATKDNFFIDGLLRYDDLETTLNSPTINIYSQKLDAHAVSASGSLGYHWDVPGSIWFVEPGIGLISSHIKVDTLNLAGATFGAVNLQGTAQLDDITSVIGRAGARVGYTTQSGNWILQPFAAASIWHEFGKDVHGNFNTCCIAPFTNTATITSSNIGTYGQYSVGLNGQLASTGWLGFVRADYRSGNRLDGFSGTGGIRYQFTPPTDLAMAYAKVTKNGKATYTKAPPPQERPYNWTGWYVGGFGGADYGHSQWAVPAAGFVSRPQIAGALVGGDAGYNYQVGSWVLGVEGDIAWTNASGTAPCTSLSPNGPPVAPFFNTNCRDTADWIGTVTGRLGLAWGHTLHYVKAGVAFDHETFSAICNLGPLNGTASTVGINCANPAGVLLNQISASDNRTGWTAGYGVEFGLTPNWSAKGELAYMDFGTKNMTATDGTLINAGFRMTQGKVGLNYRPNP
jgi:outer membrane autotransporter protein